MGPIDMRTRGNSQSLLERSIEFLRALRERVSRENGLNLGMYIGSTEWFNWHSEYKRIDGCNE
jgi:hypothetical protein